jgi:uncharacterized membrane protein
MPWVIFGAEFRIPPLHPILVNFTAALVPVSFACDLIGRRFRRPALQATGYWTLAIAAGLTPLTIAAGWWWHAQLGWGGDWTMTIHQWLGTALGLVFILWAWWRSVAYRRNRPASQAYLLATAFLLLALIIQGDLGGQMTFAPERPTTITVLPAVAVPANLHWRDHIDIPQNPAETAHGN